jgi:hypothetical protein
MSQCRIVVRGVYLFNTSITPVVKLGEIFRLLLVLDIPEGENRKFPIGQAKETPFLPRCGILEFVQKITLPETYWIFGNTNKSPPSD